MENLNSASLTGGSPSDPDFDFTILLSANDVADVSDISIDDVTIDESDLSKLSDGLTAGGATMLGLTVRIPAHLLDASSCETISSGSPQLLIQV